jgi:hypothetical protein
MPLMSFVLATFAPLRGIKLYACVKICVSTNLHSSKQQQVHVALKAHVASICFKYFRCFRCMFQEFHLNVAKVHLDVVYVAIAIYTCCKRMFQVIHVFKTYIITISSRYCKARFGCCICFYGYTCIFKRMFQMFQVFETYVANVCYKCFRCFGRICYKCCIWMLKK